VDARSVRVQGPVGGSAPTHASLPRVRQVPRAHGLRQMRSGRGAHINRPLAETGATPNAEHGRQRRVSASKGVAPVSGRDTQSVTGSDGQSAQLVDDGSDTGRERRKRGLKPRRKNLLDVCGGPEAPTRPLQHGQRASHEVAWRPHWRPLRRCLSATRKGGYPEFQGIAELAGGKGAQGGMYMK